MSSEVKQPYLKFKTTIDDDVKPKKQYFGMSDLVGIDEDILSYKGVEAYSDEPDYLTPSFHLDARILNGKPTGYENGNWYVEGDAIDSNGNKVKQVVDVDGITGYNWVTVAMTETTSAGIEPRIGVNDTMTGTIYEDKAYRKFTVCFYGGWDGWDYYRTSRSNSDEFRFNKYKGGISPMSGYGTMFSLIPNAEEFGFDGESKVITSDYYAYLAAVKQLEKWLHDDGLHTAEINEVRSEVDSSEIQDKMNQNRNIVENELRVKGIPTMIYDGGRHTGLYKTE
jgi:hypothetical protein